MPDTFSQKHHPSEIRLIRETKTLEVDFEDGQSIALPAELLRVESPSADVQGHGPSQKKTVAGRRHVGIMGVEPVGNYAVRLKFDDMHDTGIFTWDYLHDMGQRKDEMWANYLAELDQKGLSRDP
ncbi:MAG: DUF971 domain-containing protein [Rhodospirillales bacterium]